MDCFNKQKSAQNLNMMFKRKLFRGGRSREFAFAISSIMHLSLRDSACAVTWRLIMNRR